MVKSSAGMPQEHRLAGITRRNLLICGRGRAPRIGDEFARTDSPPGDECPPGMDTAVIFPGFSADSWREKNAIPCLLGTGVSRQRGGKNCALFSARCTVHFVPAATNSDGRLAGIAV